MSEATVAKQDAKESSPTPVFGSSTTFGAGAGFGGFSGATEGKPAQKTDDAGEEEAGDDEECTADFAPVVQLQEVETVSGEEAETVLVDFKSKLYRFDHEHGEWKERGVGQVKLLESKDNKKIRLLHRQEKTLKIRANHILMPNTKLQEHAGNEKAWVWSAVDFADEVQKPELFCIRFASAERAQEFRKSFDEAVAKNTLLLAEDEAAEAAESGGGDTTASVSDSKLQPSSAVKAPVTPSAADDVASKAEKLTVKDS